MTVATLTKANKYQANYAEILEEVLTQKGVISECYSMFHDFSICNQFIACSQLKAMGLPIRPIACKDAWKKKGRTIKPEQEENPIWLRMPVTSKFTDTDEDGNEVTSFKRYFIFKPNWYSLTQTEGKAIMKPSIDVNGFSVEKVMKKNDIREVGYDSVDGNCQGYCLPKEKVLAINPLAENPFKTKIHEIAHILCGHGDDNDTNSIHELEAESTAYIVMSILGTDDDTIEKMRGYIQGWFRGNTIPDKSATKIMRVANDILKAGLGE